MHPLLVSRWHPMRLIVSLEWKTCSVEAGDGFSKLALCERRVQFGKEASKTRDGCVSKNPSIVFALSGCDTCALLAQILREIKSVSLRMTTQLSERWRRHLGRSAPDFPASTVGC